MDGVAAVELHGSWTIHDFRRFQYFHFLRLGWIFLAVLLVLVMYGPVIWLFADNGPAAANAIPLSAVGAVGLVVAAFYSRWTARQEWKKNWYVREPVTMLFSAEGVQVQTAETTRPAAWELFRSVHETNSLFLLYYGADLAYIVPKRFFADPGQMKTFRAIVAAGIAPKPIHPPSMISCWC